MNLSIQNQNRCYRILEKLIFLIHINCCSFIFLHFWKLCLIHLWWNSFPFSTWWFSILLLLLIFIRSVYIVYTILGDVSIYVVGKDEYDELACMYSMNWSFIYNDGKIKVKRLLISGINAFIKNCSNISYLLMAE